MSDINVRVKECVQQLSYELPLLHFIVRQNRGMIFGGFLRFVTRFIIENARNPTIKDIYTYLIDDNGDIDIKIRYNPKRNQQKFANIFKRIQKLKGYIEFVGNDYKSYDISMYNNKDAIKITTDMSIKFGCYLIWIPIKKSFIRYELLYLKAAGVGYTEDYSVNQIEFGYQNDKRENDKRDQTKLHSYISIGHKDTLQDIRNRNLRPIFSTDLGLTGLKKLYRMIKLWNRGYRPKNVQGLRVVIQRVLSSIDTTRNRYGTFICKSDTRKPSIIDRNHHLIRFSKMKYEQITHDMFENDPVVMYIYNYVGLPLPTTISTTGPNKTHNETRKSRHKNINRTQSINNTPISWVDIVKKNLNVSNANTSNASNANTNNASNASSNTSNSTIHERRVGRLYMYSFQE